MKLSLFRFHVLSALLALSGCSTTTQEGVAEVPITSQLGGTEVFTLSEPTKPDPTHVPYEITVALPFGYNSEQNGRRYPVILQLDGQWHLPILYGLNGALHHDGDLPPALVVGLSWKTDPEALRTLRQKALYDTSFDGTKGEAGIFLAFISDTLMPHLQSHYQASDELILLGGSSGASFATYALLSRPDIVRAAVASSPTIYKDLPLLQKLANQESTQKNQLYLCKGAREPAADSDDFLTSMAQKNRKNLQVWLHIVEDAGHAGLNAECFTKGLRAVFKPQILLSVKELERYTGTYVSAEGGEVTVSINQGRLSLASEIYSGALTAYDKNAFYVPSLGRFFRFEDGSDKSAKLVYSSPYGTLSEFERP